MRVAIHQPNFVPWFPYFYKMAMSDVFVLLTDVQFEKNGFQNRYKNGDKWVTKPVKSGLCKIHEKQYADGTNLVDVNKKWIEAIALTLGIKTKILDDRNRHGLYSINEDPTKRLVDILLDIQDRDRRNRGKIFTKRKITYVTNPEAKDKYLDEKMLRDYGFDIEYCKVPSNLKKHTFEMMNEFGIDSMKKQLPKYEYDKGHPDVLKHEDAFLKSHEIAYKHGTESKEYKEYRDSAIARAFL